MRWRPWVERHGRWLAVLLFLLFFGRLLDTEAQKSLTYDEPPHVLNAVQYFQPRPSVSTINNPPLIHALMGTLIHVVGLEYNMGYDHDVWQWGNGFDIAHIFFWQINENGFIFFWIGRLTIIFLGLLLGSIIYRWAGQLYGRRLPALFALLLFTFDPNILGFSYLATTDLGIAVFMTLAGYTLWRYWRKPGMGRLLLAGVAVGLAISAKYSGMVIVPAFILLLGYRWLTEDRSRTLLKQFVVSSLIILALGLVVLLVVYRFETPLLIADYQFQQGHMNEGHQAYLLGENSRQGWWYYFPVVFLAKVPLGLLLIFGLSLILFARSRPYRWEFIWLLLLASAVFVAAMVSSLNIGFRYLLPLLPPLFIFVGQLVQPGFVKRVGNVIVATAVAIFLIASVAVHPHYTSFFNWAAGGWKNGWRIAVDSNLDWGQDLPALAQYLQERQVDDAFISWLGTVPLAEYGISGRPFLTWPPTEPDLIYDEWLPERPLPGIYAISATQLAGPYLDYAPNSLAWFQQQTPTDRVAASFFIYEVEPRGSSLGLGLSGIGIGVLAADEVAAMTDGNDIDLRWFDARSSFLWPGGGEEAVWVAIGSGHLPQHEQLQAFYPPAPTSQGEQFIEGERWQYLLYEIPASPITAVLQDGGGMTDFGWAAQPDLGANDWSAGRKALDTAVFAEKLEFLGYEPINLRPGQPLELLTVWQVVGEVERPLKLFVHLLNGAGEIVAQHDGLDVRPKGLQAGDEFAQLHTIPWPEGVTAGQYALQVGVYDAETGQRLPLDGVPSDRVLLLSFPVE